MKMKKMWRAGLLVIVTAGFSNLAVLSSLAQITASPTDQSVNVGGTATFTIADATATAYEWHLNGAILANGVNANGSTYAGVNTATLTISGVTPQDAAPAATGYACVVVDNTGNPTSNPAALVVRLVRFAFDDATGTTTTTSDTDSGVGASLNMALGATATDYHGAANSGVNGIGRALDFSAFTTQNQTPLPGPIASNNAVASLGFKTLERYTATIWFKIRAGATSISGGQNPRFFILGPSGTTDNGGNILTLKLGDGGTGINNFKANANNNELTPVQWTNNASITAEDWIFLAINYDGTTMTYYTGYVAGASSLAGSQGVSGNIAIGSSGALMIGNRAVDKARTFAGWIDDFRFFSGAGGAGLVENARLLAITAGPAVTAVVKTNNQVALSWTPFNPPGQTGTATYNVKRSTTSGGPYTLVANGAGVSDTNFTDTTATFGNTYFYAVAPFNSAGEGNPGPEASAAITTGGLTAVLNPNRSVTLNFGGTAGVQYHAQVAGNVAATPVQWTDLPGSASLASGSGAWSFTDTNTAGFSPRFYRTAAP